MSKTDVHGLLKELLGVIADARFVVNSVDFDECDMNNVTFDETNPDSAFLYDKECDIIRHLSDAVNTYERYLGTAVTQTGVLRYNKDIDRYCLNNYNFHCGDTLEVLIKDDFTETSKWVSTSFEMDSEGWYLTKCNRIKIEGLQARIRW